MQLQRVVKKNEQSNNNQFDISAGDLQVSLESLQLPSKQFVFVPVNDNSDTSKVGGMHW